MRVALLSAVESLSDKDHLSRAFARIGGRTILERQLDFAISMGCEQVACLSPGLPPELIDLQHSAENAGVRFQVIRDFRPLSGLVKATDELLVVSDGLAFDQELVSDQLKNGKVVLTLPAEGAVPAGFERLDNATAWAGVFRAKGALVEQLVNLPPDIDPQSSLLRLALQSGTKTHAVPVSALIDHKWMIVDSTEKLALFEGAWLSEAAQTVSFFGPIAAAADLSALTVVKRHDNPAKAGKIIGALDYVLMIVALLCGYLGYALAGFLVTALAAFAARFSLTASSLTKSARIATKGAKILARMPPVLIDIVLVSLVVISVPPIESIPALFAIAMLIGLIWVAVMRDGPLSSPKLLDLLEDRGILSILLGLAFVAGQLVVGIQIFAALLLALILFQTYSARITRA